MRTTVNLDEDVWLAVRERARRERRSVGQVVSHLVRQALAGPLPSGDDGAPNGAASRHGFRPLPHRGGPVSNALIDRLREDGPE